MEKGQVHPIRIEGTILQLRQLAGKLPLSIPVILVQTQFGDSDSSEQDSSCFEPDSVLEAEPWFKKFKYLLSVVSDKLKQQATSRASTPHRSIQEQLDAYIGV